MIHSQWLWGWKQHRVWPHKTIKLARTVYDTDNFSVIEELQLQEEVFSA